MKYESALVIGAGAISIDHHVPRLRNTLQCHTIDIFDVNSARRTEVRKQLKPHKTISVVDEIPTRDYDLALIATPPKFHLDYFEKLAPRVSTFIIEKPLAMTEEQCQTISAMAQTHNNTIFIPLIRRTIPSYSLAGEFYQKRTFGSLEKAAILEGGVFSWNAMSLGSFSRDLNGGGVLMDTGPHTLDILFQIFSSIEVTNSYMDGFAPAVEANCELQLIGDNKVPITFAVSRNRMFSCDLVLYFERATLAVGIRSNRIKVSTPEGSSYDIFPNNLDTCVDPSFSDLFDAFYKDHILSGDNSGLSPEQSTKIARVIDAAYKSAKPIEGGF